MILTENFILVEEIITNLMVTTEFFIINTGIIKHIIAQNFHCIIFNYVEFCYSNYKESTDPMRNFQKAYYMSNNSHNKHLSHNIRKHLYNGKFVNNQSKFLIMIILICVMIIIKIP